MILQNLNLPEDIKELILDYLVGDEEYFKRLMFKSLFTIAFSRFCFENHIRYYKNTDYFKWIKSWDEHYYRKRLSKNDHDRTLTLYIKHNEHIPFTRQQLTELLDGYYFHFTDLYIMI